MILLYILAAMAGLVMYFLTFRLNNKRRFVLAILVFAIPAVVATVWVFVVGDQPKLGAVTVNV
jgi:uncharacterized membrane protein